MTYYRRVRCITFKMTLLAAWYVFHKYSIRSFWDTTADPGTFMVRVESAYKYFTVIGDYGNYIDVKARLNALDNAAYALNA